MRSTCRKSRGNVLASVAWTAVHGDLDPRALLLTEALVTRMLSMDAN